MKKSVVIFISIIIIVLGSIYFIDKLNGKKNNSITEITYWQFWTGFEEDAIKYLVEKFNNEHSNLKVRMLTISEPWKKTLLSIIGGTPPDVLNTTSEWLPELAQRGAIVSLDDYCKEKKITKNLFIPVYWEMLTYNSMLWGLPLTPSSTAFYWNKDLFKKVGLDPEKPPVTLKELEEYSEKLTIKNENGTIKQSGFFPSWPSWANTVYPLIFNGNWGDKNNINANHPANIKSWEWACNFAQKLGPENIQSFQEEFGNIQGPNNPFYSEKIAVELNGVWEANFITKFAPKINWGVSPMYTTNGDITTSVICVPIVIPKGAKHPQEAFQFISWLMKPENIEELCIRQKKFSPLIISDRKEFINKHPNPYIKVFIDAAKSKNASYFPSTTAFQMYKRELRRAFSEVMRLEISPEDALNDIQAKMEKELQRQEKYNKLRQS